MGIRTGKPRGRPKGAQNKRTEELAAKTAESAALLSEVIAGAFDGDSHAYLMSVYKNPAYEIATRIDAAKAAIRYEKPALAAVELSGTVETNYVMAMPAVAESTEEWVNRRSASSGNLN